MVALDAGLPVEAGGLQLDRRCGSGLQAVVNATMQVATGASDVMIAGGADSMSRAALYTHEIRWGFRGGGLELHDSLARGRVTAGGINHPVPGGMLETAENLRRQYEIPRLEQDELALRSHQRAVAAQRAGLGYVARETGNKITCLTITSAAWSSRYSAALAPEPAPCGLPGGREPI